MGDEQGGVGHVESVHVVRIVRQDELQLPPVLPSHGNAGSSGGVERRLHANWNNIE